MLTEAELRKYSSALGFNLGQAEVDYLHHIFLHLLYQKVKDELVFKGGTCLQKTFGLNRFSDDLDFTKKGEVDLKDVARRMDAFGYPVEVTKEEEDELSFSLSLKVRGPLHDGTDRSAARIRVEISKREKPLLEPEVKFVTPIYHDLPPYTLSAMRAEEILSEKVRATMVRDRARDVYDLWFLLKKGIKVDLDLVNEKLGYYAMTFDREVFVQKLTEKQKLWDGELNPIVIKVPDFEVVKRDVLAAVSE